MARNRLKRTTLNLRMQRRDWYYYEVDWDDFNRLHEYRKATGMPLRQILRQAIGQWLKFHPLPTGQTPVEPWTTMVQ